MPLKTSLASALRCLVFLKKMFIGYFFKIIYLLGLGSLLLYLLSVDIPRDIQRPDSSLWILSLSLLLIGVSIAGVFWSEKKSWKKTLFYLGWMSFFPGVLSLLIIPLGDGFLSGIIAKAALPLNIKTILILSLERTIPRVVGVSIAYLLLSGLLFFGSRSLKKREKPAKKKRTSKSRSRFPL